MSSFTPALGVAKDLDASELDDVAANAGQYFLEITSVLAQVPRPLLLVFKTNDLLRSVSRSLGLAEWASVSVMSAAVLDVCAQIARRKRAEGEALDKDEEFGWRYWIEWLVVHVSLFLYESQ